MRFALNPVTLKRFEAFKKMRRAWISLWLLIGIYGLSLLANLIANDRPLVLRFEGETYFPVVQFIPESAFLPDGKNTRPNYRALDQTDVFDEKGNWMLWPLIPFGHNEGVKEQEIILPRQAEVVIAPRARAAQVDVDEKGVVLRSRSTDWLEWGERGDSLEAFPDFSTEIKNALSRRFENQSGVAVQAEMQINDTPVVVSLSDFSPRAGRPPRFVRVLIRERAETTSPETFVMNEEGVVSEASLTLWPSLEESGRTRIQEEVDALINHSYNRRSGFEVGEYAVTVSREVVTFPFRPVTGHPMGLDSSGRDVLVRILYATRISLNFGFVLVLATMAFGIAAGAIQGYYGGKVDLWSQRFIEIWESLPFLYILMLMGSVFGRSFFLLLICYGVFNWIGISYYMRAEFLRLRNLPFVDAARVTGLPSWKIIFRHILPNSLVPVITFFPFSLVGAIGMLAAVDFLGFGLPPPVASYGELLSQGQEFPFAWWLIAFPALALFVLILLGVFIGEGVQQAFNPRRTVKWDG